MTSRLVALSDTENLLCTVYYEVIYTKVLVFRVSGDISVPVLSTS